MICAGRQPKAADSTTALRMSACSATRRENWPVTPVFAQIHPDDRFKVLEASLAKLEGDLRRGAKTCNTVFAPLAKNGGWRILESTASAIKNGSSGEVEKLVIKRSTVM
mgnify:CR=1 FL=1